MFSTHWQARLFYFSSELIFPSSTFIHVNINHSKIIWQDFNIALFQNTNVATGQLSIKKPKLVNYILPSAIFTITRFVRIILSSGVSKTMAKEIFSELLSNFSIKVFPLLGRSCKIIGLSPSLVINLATLSLASSSCPWTMKIAVHSTFLAGSFAAKDCLVTDWLLKSVVCSARSKPACF